MKINGSDEIIKNSLTEKTVRREQDQKDDFKNVLKASVERSERQPGKIKSPSLANPLSAIQFHPLSPENKMMVFSAKPIPSKAARTLPMWWSMCVMIA